VPVTTHYKPNVNTRTLRNERTGRCAFISPRRRQCSDSLVVSRQSVNSGFDQDEAEFAVLVFAVPLEVLADGDGLEKQPKSVEFSLRKTGVHSQMFIERSIGRKTVRQ